MPLLIANCAIGTNKLGREKVLKISVQLHCFFFYKSQKKKKKTERQKNVDVYSFYCCCKQTGLLSVRKTTILQLFSVDLHASPIFHLKSSLRIH